MDREAMRAGRDAEPEWAAKLGAELQPNSGATPWAKLDMGDAQLLTSLKSTPGRSIDVTVAQWQEIMSALVAPGGVGGRVIGALGSRLLSTSRNPLDLITLRLEDFRGIVQEEAKWVPTTRAEQRVARGRTRELDREDSS